MFGMLKRLFGPAGSKPLELKSYSCLFSSIKLPWKVKTPGGSRVSVISPCVDIRFSILHGEIVLHRVRLSRGGTTILGSSKPLNVSSTRTGEAWYTSRLCPESQLVEAVQRELTLSKSPLRRFMLEEWRAEYPQDLVPFDPPTEKQLRYAKKLGIAVTTTMSKDDVSAAIGSGAPTDKQLSYAKKIGITVTPTMSKNDVSQAIDAAQRANPRLAEQRELVKRKVREHRFGSELIREESRWEEFAHDTKYMLAIYEWKQEIIVDVLCVTDARINERGKLVLNVDAPKYYKYKFRAIGIHLLWCRSFQLPREKLLYFEPLHSAFHAAGVAAYRRAVKRGLKTARKL